MNLDSLKDIEINKIEFLLTGQFNRINAQIISDTGIIYETYYEPKYYSELYNAVFNFNNIKIGENYKLKLFSLENFNIIFSSFYDDYSCYIDNNIIKGRPYCKIFIKPFIYIGGKFNGGLQLRIWTKNSLHEARNIESIILIHLEKLKYNYPRKDKYIDNKRFFETVGYQIYNINTMTPDIRPRGDNDRIFSIPIQINYTGYWQDEIETEYIDNIDTFITSYKRNYLKLEI